MRDDIQRVLRTVDLVVAPDLRFVIEARLGASGPATLAGHTSVRGRMLIATAAAATLAVGTVAVVTLTDEPVVADRPSQVRAAADASWLIDDQAMSCVEPFSATALSERNFAFDGTITRVDVPEPASQHPATEVVSATRVTFTVNEWFTGGSEGAVTLQTFSQPGMASTDDGPDAAVGARLLVSGDADYLWACGFTQPYSKSAAETFQAAFAT